MLIHSSVDGSTLLAVVNNAAMNIGVQISLRVPAFNYFEYVLSNSLF